MADDIWIFGYGSLIWFPEIMAAERREEILHGWHREWTWISKSRYGGPTCSLKKRGKVKGVFLRLKQVTQDDDLEKIRSRELRRSEVVLENVKGITGKVLLWKEDNNLVCFEDTRALKNLQLYQALVRRAINISKKGRDGKTPVEYAFAVHQFDPDDKKTSMYVKEIKKLQRMKISNI